MLRVNGYCPIDPHAPLAFIVPVTTPRPVLLYCPDCEAVWASREAVDAVPSRYEALRDYGLSEQTVRYATEAEVLAGGHEVDGEFPEWHPLPAPPRR